MNKVKFTLLTAALTLAIAFTLSCSSDDSGSNDYSSSSSGHGSSSGSSSSQQQKISSSSEQGGSSGSSSSQQQKISSSSEQGGNSGSSSSQQNVSSSSSSSSQKANVCGTLNKYTTEDIMAVEMNLNEPVVVAKNNAVLVEGVNYEVSATQNSIKVNGLKDYIGSVGHTSSGSASGIVVKDGSKVLTENTDYIIIGVGNSVKIAGINSYYGSVEVELPCEPELPVATLMYYGVAYTLENIPSEQDITNSINLGQMISSAVNTSGPTTLSFAGEGKICIMIPSSYPPITSIRNAMNQELLTPVGHSMFNRGQIQYSGNSYTLYTQDGAGVHGSNLTMNF